MANLKSAAQLSALNTVLNNLQAQAKKRYQKAQQDYQKRADASTDTTINGGVDETATGGGYDIADGDIGVTTMPIEGRNTTSYVDVDGNTVDVVEGGDTYINGVKVTQPQGFMLQPKSVGERAGDALLDRVNPVIGFVNRLGKFIEEGKW